MGCGVCERGDAACVHGDPTSERACVRGDSASEGAWGLRASVRACVCACMVTLHASGRGDLQAGGHTDLQADGRADLQVGGREDLQVGGREDPACEQA